MWAVGGAMTLGLFVGGHIIANDKLSRDRDALQVEEIHTVDKDSRKRDDVIKTTVFEEIKEFRVEQTAVNYKILGELGKLTKDNQ